MKRYLSGIVAVVIAIMAFAFTNNSSNLPAGTKLFYYEDPSSAAQPYSKDNVEKPANWHLTSSTIGCPPKDEKACELLVDESFVTSGNMLSPSFTIVAAEHNSTGIHYVQSSDADVIYNTRQ